MSASDSVQVGSGTAADRRQAAVRSLEHEVGTLLRRIRRGLSERAAQVHPDLNPVSYMLLATVNEHGARRASELAEMFALDKGTVSRVVHQLMELGLVERSPDPDDRRASILSATDEAVRRIAKVHQHGREHFDERLATWDPAEIEDLAERLSRFNVALSDPS